MALKASDSTSKRRLSGDVSGNWLGLEEEDVVGWGSSGSRSSKRRSERSESESSALYSLNISSSYCLSKRESTSELSSYTGDCVSFSGVPPVIFGWSQYRRVRDFSGRSWSLIAARRWWMAEELTIWRVGVAST